MKKLYSIVLMATALLIGTNAWATEPSDIQAAFTNGGDITLTTNVVVTSPLQMYAQKEEAGKTVNLNLNGFTISTSSAKAIIELYKGTLNITGPGRIVTDANAEAIKVFGYCKDVADWSILNIGEGVSVESTKGSSTARLAANAISVLELRAKYCTYIKTDYAGIDLSDEYGVNVDPAPATYKTTYYVNGDVDGGARKRASVAAGNALVDNGTIDYSSSIYKAGTKVYSLKDSQNRTYEYVKLSAACAAFGVKVNVQPGAFVYGDKYGIKINGTIAVNGTNIPTVHIANGAEVKAAAEDVNATAVYSSGYGQFIIDGYVHGSTGVYVKSGSVVVNDGAKIQSDNNTGNGINSTGASSGINAGGNAISIEGDNAAYSSNGISLEINGGTIIAGEGGYAVEHENNDGTPANSNSVEINGGTFTGGTSGGVSIDNAGGKVVNVDLEGGTFTGDIETLIAAAGANNVIQEVVAQEGGQATVVIGKKEAGDEVEQPATPQEKEEFVFANDMSNDIVKLDATTANIAKTLPAGTTEVKYLSLTGTGAYTSTVTVEAGKTLKVGQIVMNANGRLIVEAGATLIVSGANGIFADNIENLVLKTSEAEQAIFLLNPAVAANKHPKATVEFITKSFMKAGVNVFQRFGIPTHTALESMECSDPSIRTRVWEYSAATDSWQEFGDLGSFDIHQLNVPFAGYNMISYRETPGLVYTMKGALVGNDDASLDANMHWTTFANSFSADIDVAQFVASINGTVDPTVYMYKVTNALTQEYTWEPVNATILADFHDESLSKIAPMRAFILNNKGTSAQLNAVNYASMVYAPATSVSNPAPRRAVASNNTAKLSVRIANEQGAWDKLYLLENDDFSAEYESGRDAEKYMNEDINVYAQAEEKQAILATNDLSDTYVGFSTVKGGKFTISFANVAGREFVLVDHETGARVAMVEGNTYEFTAAANSANDYRFEIVGAAKLPTAIENAEAVKSAKGIYTITGQYVGEMSVWNSLPAGIYVVNGEKLVK